MTTRDERETLAHFQERYAAPTNELTNQIEERVIGARWGANGYTTLNQADELARRLDLRPGVRVLDVGTGRGWPGVYFAVAYGCDVVGSDMPIDALAAAARRACQEGAAARFAAVVAVGTNQPFRPSSFDAVVHTDVLC
jgi:2-polyprenyl-3-methyl-5-hydroxy-6-metoxy-1,4-benzoquinol methylase